MKQCNREGKTVVGKFENKYVDKSERSSIKNEIFSKVDKLRTAELVRQDNPKR